MALQKQPASLQFAGGVETKIDPKQAPATRLLDLQNAVFTRATTLSKRNGYQALSLAIEGGAGLTIQSPVGLAVRDDETLLFDGRKCYSRREAQNAWSDAGEVCSTVISDSTIARTGTQQSQADHATNNGVTVAAWEDSRGGVWASVVDAITGRIIQPDTQLDAAGISPRCLANGTRLHIIWANTAMRHLRIVVVDPVNATGTLAVAELADDLDPANPVYDAITTSPSAPDWTANLRPCVVAWAIDSGGYRVGYIAESGVLGSALTSLPDVASRAVTVSPGPIAITYDEIGTAIVTVIYTGPVNMSFECLATDSLGTLQSSGDLMSSTNATRAAVTFAGAGVFWWAIETLGTRIDTSTITTGSNFQVTGAVVTSPTGRVLRGHCLASRAFYDNGDIYVAIIHPVTFFSYVAIVRVSGSIWGSRTITAARMLAGLSTGALPRSHVPCAQPISPSTATGLSRQHAIAIGYRIQLGVDSSQLASSNFSEAGIKIAEIDFANANAYQCAQLGRGLYMASGVLMSYDGSRWAESNFHCAPDFGPDLSSSFSTIVDAAGAIAPGTYGYKVCYEEIDNEGEIHPGPIWVQINVVIAGPNNAIQFGLIPTCRLTSKKNVRIAVFRSPANQTGTPDSIPFYRVSGLDPKIVAGPNCYLANDPTIDAVSFVDDLSDAQLLKREPLYTNGGILSNDPTPCAGGAIATGKSRLYWTDPSDPQLVRFSQQLREDTALEEAPGLFVRVDPYGGNIVAISVLDDAIVVHKETSTYAFGGPGPDADGGAATQSAFSPPQLVTSDVGCSSPRSVVQMPLGVMFATSKGIMLLGRDRQTVASVGDPVYAYKDQIISRATLIPDRHQVVFLTSAGRTLLYDYEHQQWSTYTNHLGLDAVVTNGTYQYLRTDGRLFRETPGLYADDNVHIPMLISTAWIKMAGYLQAFQRVIHASAIGTYKSPHQLSMRFRIDYQDSWSQPILIDMGALYGGSSYGVGNYGVNNYDGDPTPLGTVYQAAWHINRRCQAIAFEFTDVEATATFGAAFELSELLLIGGVLGPRFPVGASRSR